MLNEYIRVFRAFTDENRIRVLELLCKGEQCACVLLADMEISQPTLSHHMKILCASGIVKCRRVGKWNYYSIDREGCAFGGRLLEGLAGGKMEGMLRIARRIHRIRQSFQAARGLFRSEKCEAGATQPSGDFQPNGSQSVCCCSK